MTLSTAFTEPFGVRRPIASAPRGGPVGGAHLRPAADLVAGLAARAEDASARAGGRGGV
ncbi:hypothetical protein [Streptomyces zaehneri]|uniref:hypothetical protein n=1 Tax=Streptomyces zaehneri TaxID=3051180 RepID=UPI0028D1BBD4|nr:hypothetical protein [Streptomyces sp. DSM 40713]